VGIKKIVQNYDNIFQSGIQDSTEVVNALSGKQGFEKCSLFRAKGGLWSNLLDSLWSHAGIVSQQGRKRVGAG